MRNLAFKRTIMSAGEIDDAVHRMAKAIIEIYPNLPNAAIVGVKTNGVPLARRLIEKLELMSSVRMDLGMLDINLYMEDWQAIAERPIIHTTDIPFSLRDKNIILIDDILASGRTTQAAMESLLDGGRPHSIWLGVLIDIGHRRFPIQPDFCGRKVTVDEDEILIVNLQAGPGTDPDHPEGVIVIARPDSTSSPAKGETA